MLHAMKKRGYLASVEEREGSTARRVYRATDMGREALKVARERGRELFGELHVDGPGTRGSATD